MEKNINIENGTVELREGTNSPSEILRLKELQVRDAGRVIELMVEARRYRSELSKTKESVPEYALSELAEELQKTWFYKDKELEMIKRRVRKMFADYSFDREISEFQEYRSDAVETIRKINADMSKKYDIAQ